MALTRKQLKEMGLSEEQIDAIIAAHMDTVEGLKDRIRTLEGEAQALLDPQRQPEDARNSDSEDWKGRHDRVRKEFDDYRAEVAGREQAAKVKAAYKALLEEERIDPRRFEVVLRATLFDGMKLDSEGRLEDAGRLREDIRRDWGDFVQTSGQRGADVHENPAGGGDRLTRDEIMMIEDPDARRRAIAENHELFGF